MKNKLITLVVAALLLFSMCTSIAYAGIDDLPEEGSYFYYNSSQLKTDKAGIKGSSYGFAYEVLQYLNILQNDILEADATATRGLAAQIFGVMKARFIVKAESAPFFDVPMNNPFVDGIATAKECGIANDYGDGKFLPDNGISVSDATDMAMRVLGYDVMPKHYMESSAVAKIKNNLLKGIDLSKEILTNGDLLIMALNTLESPKYDSNSYVIVDDVLYPVYDKGDSQNILLEDFNVQLERGVVTAVDTYSLFTTPYFRKNKIEINRRQYSTLSLPDSELFGKSVYAYIDTTRDNGTVITVWEDERNNNIISLDPDNCEFTSYQEAVYYDEQGREISVDIDENALAVYNLESGVSFKHAMMQNLTAQANSIVLIDNNGDNLVDVILLREYDYRVVDNISSSGIIYFKYDKPKIDVADIEFMEMDGKKTQIANIKNGDVAMVLSAKRSGKQRYVVIFARDVASGILESVDTSEGRLVFSIDGESFEATDFYEEYYTKSTINPEELRPKIGEKATCYLAADGKIASSFVSDDGWNFAYLVGCNKSASLNETVYIKVFTQSMFVFEKYAIDKEIELYTWPDSASSYSVEKKAKPKTVYDALVSGNEYTTEMVGYRLDTNGNIIALATEYTGQMGSVPFVSNYPLVKNFVTGEVMPDGSTQKWLYMRVLGTYYNLSKVPRGIQAPPYGADRSKEIFYGKWAHDADEQFAADNTTGRSLAIYNSDSCGNAGLLLYKPEPGSTGGTGTIVNGYANPVIVSKKVITVTDDGEEVTRIYYPRRTSTVSIDFSPNVTFSFVEEGSADYYGKPASPMDVEPGDIIQWEEDSFGRIVTVRILFKNSDRGPYRTQMGTSSITTDNAKLFNSSLIMTWGKVMDKQGVSLIQNLSPTGNDEPEYNYPMFFNGNRNSVHTDGTMYILWDSVREKAEIVSINEIQVGDEIVVVSDYNVSYRGFIYR